MNFENTSCTQRQHPHRPAVGHPESNKLAWTHCCSAVHSDFFFFFYGNSDKTRLFILAERWSGEYVLGYGMKTLVCRCNAKIIRLNFVLRINDAGVFFFFPFPQDAPAYTPS